jgi:hypothetical protein
VEGLVKEFELCLVTFCIMASVFKFSCLLVLTKCVCLLASRRIKHENIVALEDIYESPNHLYLVMQL